jgi:hypothetical protein
MFHIQKLAFGQVQYVERCSLVPHGEIIQTAHNDQVVVGMRTYYEGPMGGDEAIMLLGGNDHCNLLSLEALGNGAALVITNLVRFVATDILPFNPTYKPPTVGNLRILTRH